ncbi:hypothetical protein DFH28DRAFT_897152 [Melampsora americana]|nr:hypothetical protein DFH28DRAFT_897152 [Melampsora americana]
MSSYCLKTQLPRFIKPSINSSNLTPSNLIDFHLINNPTYPFGILANDSKEEKGIEEKDLVTWNEIGNSMIKVVKELKPMRKIKDQKSNVIGIIASGDPLVYFTMLLAIMRSGCVPFAISPRNSIPGIVHLIKSTNCKTLYVQFDPNPTKDFKNLSLIEQINFKQIQEVLKSLYPNQIQLLQFPTSFELFPRLITNKPYLQNPTVYKKLSLLSKDIFSNLQAYSTLMILHSSGTTAFPKPIYLNKFNFQSWIQASEYTKFNWQGEILASMVLPPFHAMGIHFGLINGLSDGSISGFFKAQINNDGKCVTKIPNSLNVLKAIKTLKCTIGAFSPLMLAEFASDPDSIKVLKSFKRVGFGGGPLTVEIGNKLYKEGIQLSAMYGSTEVGIIATLFPENTFGMNWEYFEISKQLTKQLIPHEDLYELVILSSDFHRCALDHIDYQLSNQVYHTNDLLAKHPFLELYRIVGRMDDQIMLSNSEKTNPGPLEAILAFHPAIKGSLLFGRGKPQNGVMIEPEDEYLVDTRNRKEVNNYIDLIWSSIEEVNRFAPTHSRLTRELILITDPRITPLPKTTKGQVARVKTLELFSNQIEEIYSSQFNGSFKMDGDHHGLVAENGVMKFENVLRCVKGIIEEVLNWKVDEDKDLFLQGCDSLSAIQIRLKLNQLFLLSSSKKSILIPQNIVYRYPSISELSQWIFQTLTGSKPLKKSIIKPCEPLVSMILKYSPTKKTLII